MQPPQVHLLSFDHPSSPVHRRDQVGHASLLAKRERSDPSQSITTDEWMNAINFLTRTGQTCTPIRQEFILLSDVLGVSSLVEGINNPNVSNGTASSALGPFFTEDAPDGTVTACKPERLFSPNHQSIPVIPSPPRAKESICTSKGACWISMGSRYRTLQLKLGKQILRVLPCLAYCIRVADDKSPKGSTILNIQIGPLPIAEEDCGVTRRVATDTGLLCPWHILSQVMYGDPTLIFDQR